MPGHKMGRLIPEEFLNDIPAIDVTEIPGTDNLHDPKGAIMHAQQLAAQAFGADKTFFLVNGSTCGIHSMIMAICRPGDKLIISRDCHKSVFIGIALTGAIPAYIVPEVDRNFGICNVITPEQVEEAIKKNPDAVGVLITRPTYYGLCCDIKAIADIVHFYGKILAVDEAHGAHLRFNPRLPVCAMDAGADICVQSAHKTLPALTQTAYLHVKGRRVDIGRLSYYLSVLQTSSPSYILMASLDIARACMQECGSRLLDNTLDYAELLKKRVSGITGMEMLWKDEEDLCQQDKTRIVINVADVTGTGFEAERILRDEFNIQIEMSDINNIVMISTVADRYEDFLKLGDGLEYLADCNRENVNIKTISDNSDIYSGFINIVQEQVIEYSKAVNSKGIYIKLEKAADRICKNLIIPYPPGIPLVCPGERLNKNTIEYIYNVKNAGGVIMGITDEMEVNVVE